MHTSPSSWEEFIEKKDSFIDRNKVADNFETFLWQPFPVKNVTSKFWKDFEQKRSFHSPRIQVIDSSRLFLPTEVVIGVWRPNVFTLIPDDQWHLRFAAKSFKRADTTLEETKW